MIVLPLGFGGWWDRGQRREIQLHGVGRLLIITLLHSARFGIQWGTAEGPVAGREEECRQGKIPSATLGGRKCPENDGAQSKATPRIRGAFPDSPSL